MSKDTNQASEDELDKILVDYASKYFQLLRTGAPRELEAKIRKEAKTATQSIIRTEKLKLLAEVRERVVGTKDLKLSDIYGNDWRNNYGYAEGQVRDAANHLQRKQLKSLTKLEAEL